MKAGLVIYASSLNRLTEFYSHVFAFEVIENDSTYSLLTNNEFELVLLETEASTKTGISFKPRETTPLKPVFFVQQPLPEISESISRNGGHVYPPKAWEFGGRQVCDAHDCEGNIFQLRIKIDA